MGCSASVPEVSDVQPVGAVSHFLYYWDNRDGENWSGWWITPRKIGDMKFVLHNPSRADLPGQCPKSGWSVGPGIEKQMGGQPGCYVSSDGDGWCVTGGKTQIIGSVDHSAYIFMPCGTNHGKPAYKAVPRSELRPATSAPTGYGAHKQEAENNFEGMELPGAYVASGAAISAANGIYVRDGTHSGAPVFKNGQLWLVRYTIGQTRYWYIADKDQLDSDDGDLYRVMCTGALPPKIGWALAKDGVAPAPTLLPIADRGPVGFLVSGAGHPGANGMYARDGSYGSSPLFKQVNGPSWLLRFTLSNGGHVWCIAHKDMLDSADGPLYRVVSDDDFPPVDGWGFAKSGIAPVPTLSPIFPQQATPAITQPVAMAQPVVQPMAQPVAQFIAPAMVQPVVPVVPVMQVQQVQPVAMAQPMLQPVAQPMAAAIAQPMPVTVGQPLGAPASVHDLKEESSLSSCRADEPSWEAQFRQLAWLIKQKVGDGDADSELPLPNAEHPTYYASYQITGVNVMGRKTGMWTLTDANDKSKVQEYGTDQEFAQSAVRLLGLQ